VERKISSSRLFFFLAALREPVFPSFASRALVDCEGGSREAAKKKEGAKGAVGMWV
jgi:hypothetical protein